MLIDSHVHIYSCFDIDDLLDSAAANFQRVGDASVAGRDRAKLVGCLALTETARDHVYAAIASGDRRWKPKRWSVRATQDDAAIVLRSPANEELVMLAGCQIATAERLEVLALATTKRYADRRPLTETLAALAADRVAAVIPWGFGKWWLGRGRLLEQLVKRSEPRAFFLGDSGSRPTGSPRPKLFDAAELNGFQVLPGTDSFPYPSQQGKAGSFGFVLDSWRTDDRPAAEFRSQLARLRRSPPTFGSRVNLVEFSWLQVAMNARIRLQRAA
jgi:hypothetical protein